MFSFVKRKRMSLPNEAILKVHLVTSIPFGATTLMPGRTTLPKEHRVGL